MTNQPPSPESSEDLLVAYALGVLGPDELQQLTTLLHERPELRHEIAALRQVADGLPYALPDAQPPPDLRQRIIARATGEPVVARGLATAPERVARPWWQQTWLTALSTALAGVFLALTLWQQWRVSDQQTHIQELQKQVGQMNGLTSDRQALIALLANPEVNVSIGTSANGNVTFVRSAEGDAVVAQLPPLQTGRTYQLWLLRDSTSSPNSAGTFTVDGEGRGLLLLADTPINPVDAHIFAVTNEPAGGSALPTTDILVSGQTAQS